MHSFKNSGRMETVIVNSSSPDYERGINSNLRILVINQQNPTTDTEEVNSSLRHSMLFTVTIYTYIYLLVVKLALPITWPK